MDLEYLVSFNCSVRIHFAVGSRHPVQHSCKFSLALIGGSQPCFVMEGAGIGKPRKLKFSSSSLGTIAARRIGDGCLSVTGHNLDWDTIAVSDVRDIQALRRFHQLLSSIFNGVPLKDVSSSGGRGQGSTAGRTPPPSVLVNRRSPGDLSLSTKKKRTYTPNHSNNWRGASMVAAALSGTSMVATVPRIIPSDKTNSFYGSKTPANSSLTSPLSSSSKERSGNKSAKRALLLDDKDSKSEEKDNFLPSPNYRLPAADSTAKYQRPPLGALSTPPHQTSNVAKGNRKLEHLLRSEVDPDGFANLGNTCYMNAVLQSLLGLYPFAEDLQNPHIIKNVHSSSLYRMVVILLKCKRAKDSFENQRILLKKIKGVISASTPKFFGFGQQDAHELLSQCLDQLKEDAECIGNHSNGSSGPRSDESANSPSPVVVNFENDIERRIVCKECGHVTRTSQLNYDFSLQLPKRVHHNHSEQANLQQLFDQFFADEEVEFNCTSCQCKSATLSLQLAKLPRILILHLKRYGYNQQLSENSKRVDNIRIPRYINVGHLTKSQCVPPSAFTAPNPRDLHSLSSMLGQNEEKENLPTTAPAAQEPTPLTQTPPLTQRPTVSTQETTTSSQMAKSSEVNHDAHTTITSYTPPTTPTLTSPTKGTAHTSKEEPIEIIDSDLEEEATSDVTPAKSHDTSAKSHDSHISGRGHSLFPASQSLQREQLHRQSSPSCSSTAGASVRDSVLGKRKRCAGECGPDPSNQDLPHKTVCMNNNCVKCDTPISRVPTEPNSDHCERKGGEHVRVDNLNTGDSGMGTESVGPVHENGALAVFGTGMKYSTRTLEPDSQNAKDQSQAIVDDMLATVSLEELSGFPVVALDNTTTSTTNNLTTPTNVTAPGGGVPNDMQLSEIGGDATCAAAVADGDDKRLSLFNQEQVDIERALQESLKSQKVASDEFQLEGLSEEEQLRLALELSIQDSVPNEATPSSSTYWETTPVQRIQTTPTPEKHLHETYRLVSIVNHIGRGSAGGHYISDVYSFPDHSWRTYNDEQVSEVREEDVRQRRQTTGYVFFYLHRATFTSVSAQFGR